MGFLNSHIEIVVDLESIAWESGGNATGVVYFEIGESSFPGPGWNDFILIVYSW